MWLGQLKGCGQGQKNVDYKKITHTLHDSYGYIYYYSSPATSNVNGAVLSLWHIGPMSGPIDQGRGIHQTKPILVTVSETCTVLGPVGVLGNMGITGVYYNILDVSPGQVGAARTQAIISTAIMTVKWVWLQLDCIF